MIRVTAPWFVAGLVLGPNGHVIRAADVISYMIGWPRARVLRYCAHRRWTAEQL